MQSNRNAITMLTLLALAAGTACKTRTYTESDHQKAEVKKEAATAEITYILSDGRKVDKTKLDSIRTAWGADRVIMRHDEDDDEKKIVRLEQLTDQKIQEMTNGGKAQQDALTALIDKPALDFSATDIKGKTVNLSQLKGKVVVLNFWFTSCIPCIKEMPELNKLAAKYKGRDVVFLGITFNDKDKATAFLKRHPFDYRILVKATDVIKNYSIHNYPTSIVIDKHGDLKQYFVSGQDIADQLSASIDRALS